MGTFCTFISIEWITIFSKLFFSHLFLYNKELNPFLDSVRQMKDYNALVRELEIAKPYFESISPRLIGAK